MSTTVTTLAQLEAARDAAHSAWAAANAEFEANPSWQTIAALGETCAAYERAAAEVELATFAATA